MGAWGSAPWDTDGAADWFAEFFEGIDADARISEAFEADDDYDRIRAAGYLLAVLGRGYIWPGDLERLDALLKRGVELLSEMLEPDSEFRELWEDDPEVLAAVRAELTVLETRLNGDPGESESESESESEEDDEAEAPAES